MTAPMDTNSSIVILGHSFLGNFEANINCKTRVIEMSYEGERVPLKLVNKIKYFEDILEQEDNGYFQTIKIEHHQNILEHIFH